MKAKKSKLEKLSRRQIKAISAATEKRRDIPLVKSSQVNMRLDEQHLARAKALADAQGVPYTTFLTRLLCEDLDRLWAVYRNGNDKEDVAS